MQCIFRISATFNAIFIDFIIFIIINFFSIFSSSDTASATFSQETLQSLRLPAFDSYAWSDEQLLLLLHGMFTELELTSTFRIKDAVLRQFLYEVYKHYNEVPFHNFRHCFCVAQMVRGNRKSS